MRVAWQFVAGTANAAASPCTGAACSGAAGVCRRVLIRSSFFFAFMQGLGKLPRLTDLEFGSNVAGAQSRCTRMAARDASCLLLPLLVMLLPLCLMQ